MTRTFGVATLAGDTITNITEKPKQPASNWRLLLHVDSQVFDIIRTCKPSARGRCILIWMLPI